MCISLSIYIYYTNNTSTNTNMLCEPLPCDPEAEAVLQSLSRCSESSACQGCSSPGECVFLHRHRYEFTKKESKASGCRCFDTRSTSRLCNHCHCAVVIGRHPGGEVSRALPGVGGMIYAQSPY